MGDVNMTEVEKPKIRVVKKVVKRRPLVKQNNDSIQPNINNNTIDTHVNNNNNNNNINTTGNVTSSNSENIHPNVEKKMNILKDNLKEKARFENLTFEAQIYCLDNEITELELKNEYSKYFIPDNYQDLVVERSIAMKCGYPCCKNRLQKNQQQQRLKISLAELRIYNIEELSMYCSSDCLIKSNLFKSTLDITPIYLRTISSNIKLESITVKKNNEFLNTFEKKLNIEENQNASLQPPNLDFKKERDFEKVLTNNNNTKSPKENIKKSIRQPPPPVSSSSNDQDILNRDQKLLLDELLEEMDSELGAIKKDNKNNIKDDEEEDGESSSESYDENDDEDDEDSSKIISNKHGGNKDLDDSDYSSDSDDEMYHSTGDSGNEGESFYSFLSDTSHDFSKSFKASDYHSIYSALSEWVTKSTNQYLNNNNNGGNHKVSQNYQIKSTLQHHLSNVYPVVLSDLNLSANLKDQFSSLIDTFNLTRPIPSLKLNHWKLILLLFIKILIQNQLSNNDQTILVSLISKYGLDIESFKVFENLCLNGYD